MKTIEQWAEQLGISATDPEITFDDMRAIQRDAFDAGAQAMQLAAEGAMTLADIPGIRIEHLRERP